MATQQYPKYTYNPVLTLRDFRQGRYSNQAVATYLLPDNSVNLSQNVNFDATVGLAVVRPGTTKIGATVASSKTPLGLTNFVGHGGSPNLLLAVYSGTTYSSLYYYDTSWHTSALTALSNSAKNRFDNLGGRVFMTNPTDGMQASADGNSFSTTNCILVAKPSLVKRYKQRLLAAGSATYPDRVYFSSIISKTTDVPFITWNEDNDTGDWIDVNPDDGGNITGFSEASNFCLVFKNTGMYRMDTVSKTVDMANIFNIGAVSQEAITQCQGATYFFSGQDIRSTSGDFPIQISRAGVQDIVDAIPQASWASVCAGTDGFNVYFSVGNITWHANQDDQLTIPNCVLKYSPRDTNWSIHSYADAFQFFTQFLASAGKTFVGADASGDVQTLNSGASDNGSAINYFLQSQELEFGDRSHTKKISDRVAVFTQYGQDGSLDMREDDGGFKSMNVKLTKRVNMTKDVNYEGHYFTLRWYGETSGKSPIFEGVEFETVTDQGFIN